MEYDARSAGTNRLIASTPATREVALRAISADIHRLARQGYSEDRLTPVVMEWVDGLVQQLFNHPLDMFVEKRVHDGLPALRANQLVSLTSTNASNRAAIVNDEIKRLAPRTIYDASAALNAAYALFCDELLGGRTRFADGYDERQLTAGRRLFTMWHDTLDTFSPGDEYDLVDAYARVLKLQGWYEWRRDPLAQQMTAEHTEGASNPELLRSKEMATVMYLLDGLKRFSQMDHSVVAEVAIEIGSIGRNGIDYASSDKSYTVSVFPGETFSGLHMLALMYVAFKKIDPSMDTGLDLDDAYRIAQSLYSPAG